MCAQMAKTNFDYKRENTMQTEEHKFNSKKSVNTETIVDIQSQEFFYNTSEARNKLHAVDRIASQVTLENCMEQLLILKIFLNEIEHESYNKLFQYIPPDQRFTMSAKSKKRFEEEVYEGIPYTNFQKLQMDISFVCNIIRETCREISTNGYYTPLIKAILGVKQEELENTSIEDEHKSCMLEIIKLNTRLKREYDILTEELEENNKLIYQLQIKLEDVHGFGKVELRYTDDWVTARESQNDLRLNLNENVFIDETNTHVTKIESEHRIHNEITNFIEEDMEDLKNAIQYWMQHYDDEIERKDSEILRMQIKWEVMSEDHRQLGFLYEDHKIAIQEWLTFKEERRRQEELFNLQLFAAVKIQAWWRGTMVRKHLGPFAKKKATGKDKGKGGKDKGKGKSKSQNKGKKK